MKPSCPGLLFFGRFFISFYFNASSWVIIISISSWFSRGRDCTFLRICPFLPGYPFYCHIVVHNSLIFLFIYKFIYSVLRIFLVKWILRYFKSEYKIMCTESFVLWTSQLLDLWNKFAWKVSDSHSLAIYIWAGLWLLYNLDSLFITKQMMEVILSN